MFYFFIFLKQSQAYLHTLAADVLCEYHQSFFSYFLLFVVHKGAKGSSVVEHPLLVQWFVKLIPHDGLTSPSQCSTTGVTETMVCAILSVGWCIQNISCF